VSYESQKKIILEMEEHHFRSFFHQLQAGVRVPANVGSTIHCFLTEELALRPQYIEERIPAIALDGMLVDDPRVVILEEGSQLALSGSLPGLFGASVRRKGFCSSFRTSITHGESAEARSPHPGTIILKLYNLLIEELGPLVLGRGIFEGEGRLTVIRFIKNSRTSGNA
jgi:hypothetical protein